MREESPQATHFHLKKGLGRLSLTSISSFGKAVEIMGLMVPNSTQWKFGWVMSGDSFL